MARVWMRAGGNKAYCRWGVDGGKGVRPAQRISMLLRGESLLRQPDPCLGCALPPKAAPNPGDHPLHAVRAADTCPSVLYLPPSVRPDIQDLFLSFLQFERI